MSNEIFHGIVRDGVVIFYGDAPPLSDGTEVNVTRVNRVAGLSDLIQEIEKEDQERGAPAVVLAAVDGAPHVPAEWVDELEKLIAQGRRPPTLVNPFAESD